MAAQRGVDVVVKVGDGAASEAFATVGGARTQSLALNAQPVDATSAASTGQWRELLDGAGILSADLSVSGVFQDGAPDEELRGYYFTRALANYQFIFPDFGTIAGAFYITNLQYAGAHDGEATFELSLQSGGQLTFTAAGA